MTDQTHFLEGKKVFVAGHRGMVGSAVLRRLERVDCDVVTVGREDVDLINQLSVESWFAEHRPDVVVLAAAKVGGILANDSCPADFLYQNLMIEANTVEAARRSGVSRLLFLGSSCIYPKFAAQPITEDALLSGPLEPTNEWYAIAKIAGIKLVQAYRRQYGCDYISAMPTNLYGPGDNFDLQTSHVLPALIRKAHDAKHSGARTLDIWGSGTPRREFLHVDDLADACVFLLENYSGDGHLNIGSGSDLTIEELANKVAQVVGFTGDLIFDTSKPDGTPRKLMDSRRISALGWSPNIGLDEGVLATYRWYLDNRV